MVVGGAMDHKPLMVWMVSKICHGSDQQKNSNDYNFPGDSCFFAADIN